MPTFHDHTNNTTENEHKQQRKASFQTFLAYFYSQFHGMYKLELEDHFYKIFLIIQYFQICSTRIHIFAPEIYWVGDKIPTIPLWNQQAPHCSTNMLPARKCTNAQCNALILTIVHCSVSGKCPLLGKHPCTKFQGLNVAALYAIYIPG